MADCIMIGGNSVATNGKSLNENVEFTVKPYDATSPTTPQINPLLILLIVGGVAVTGIYFLTKKKKK